MSHRLWMIGILLIVEAISLSGCSAGQLYATGQSWQRNQCNQIMDQQERSRCLSSTHTSYEAYQQESSSRNQQK